MKAMNKQRLAGYAGVSVKTLSSPSFSRRKTTYRAESK